MKPSADAHDPQLVVEMLPAGLQISGDKKRLVQVVANLLSNAVKYTPNKGNITVYTRVHDGQVTLVVRDDGIGMSSDLAEKAFEIFVQGERTADRSQGDLVSMFAS